MKSEEWTQSIPRNIENIILPRRLFHHLFRICCETIVHYDAPRFLNWQNTKNPKREGNHFDPHSVEKQANYNDIPLIQILDLHVEHPTYDLIHWFHFWAQSAELFWQSFRHDTIHPNLNELISVSDAWQCTKLNQPFNGVANWPPSSRWRS